MLVSRSKFIWLMAATAGALSIVLLFAPRETTAEHDPSAVLDSLLREKEYPEFERKLSTMRLTRVDSDYFQGVLANRQNRVAESATLLKKAISKLKDRNRIEIALEALADDYQKVFRYADAARVLSDVLDHYSKEIDATRKKGVENDFHLAELLRTARPQTLKAGGNSTVAIRRSRFGHIEVPVTVGDRSEWWVFDTGASFTAITMSTAKRLGLDISKESASTRGATGADLSLRTAVIPQVLLGKAELRNVVALVLDDSSLAIPIGEEKPYQIEGILGFPVMAAFDSLTFFREERMVIGGEDLPNSISFPIYLDGNAPLIAARVGERSLVFSLDTGANGSQFTQKYFKAFQEIFASEQKVPFAFSGAGGAKETQVHRQKMVELGGDGGTIRLGSVAVMTEPAGIGGIDDYYGNIGQDVLKKVRNFTLDFRHMRLRTSQPPQ